jgi:DNA-binding response OmpR family regulator
MALVSKVLLVSNLQATSPFWSFKNSQQHWNVILESRPANAVARCVELLPDLIVCDNDSDSINMDVITKLRDEFALPILLLTPNQSDTFILDAYQVGVDDCILKPAHPLILEAKVKAWLRRSCNVPGDVLDSLKVTDLQLIPVDRTVVLDNREPMHLTNLEVRLLYYLMGHARRTVTARELCQHVWGSNSDVDTTTLKNLVYRLRHKIEADPAHPHYVRTVAGVGYQFLAKKD